MQATYYLTVSVGQRDVVTFSSVTQSAVRSVLHHALEEVGRLALEYAENTQPAYASLTTVSISINKVVSG